MPYQIRKAAVLGAGVMGAAIAAHLASVGIPSLLLDIVPADVGKDRDKVARTGLEKAINARPQPGWHGRVTGSYASYFDDRQTTAQLDVISAKQKQNVKKGHLNTRQDYMLSCILMMCIFLGDV